MSDDNTPESGTVEDPDVSVQGAADALAEILDDPLDEDTGEDDGPAEDDADDPESDPEAGKDEGEDDAESEEDSEDEDDSDDSEDDSESEDGELKGGRIAPLSAKVRMPDGSLTTVEELRSSYFRRSDYTQKQQDLSRQREEFQVERQRVGETAQQLDQSLQTLTAYVEATKPQPPQDPQADPYGYQQYQIRRDQWEQWKSAVEQQRSQAYEVAKSEQDAQLQKARSTEEQKLVDRFPAMGDPAKKAAFKSEMARFLSDYGFSKEDVEQAYDHRSILVVRDLMQAKRRLDKASETRQQIEKKPKMLKGSRRGAPAASKGKKVRAERLQKTGRIEDAVSSLMDLDL